MAQGDISAAADIADERISTLPPLARDPRAALELKDALHTAIFTGIAAGQIAQTSVAKINAMFKEKSGKDLNDFSSRQFMGLIVMADAINRATSPSSGKRPRAFFENRSFPSTLISKTPPRPETSTVFVPSVTFSMSCPFSSTAAMRRFVPPRSTPIEKFDISSQRETDYTFREWIVDLRKTGAI